MKEPERFEPEIDPCHECNTHDCDACQATMGSCDTGQYVEYDVWAELNRECERLKRENARLKLSGISDL